MVKDQMDLIIVTALAVQCGCEVVCPLGTCLDPRWLPIAWTTAIPSMTVTFLVAMEQFPLVADHHQFCSAAPQV